MAPYEEMSDEDRADACAAIVIVAAQRWADAMEHSIDQGASIARCAADAFTTVDRELGAWHLSGFHYGLCVGLLAKVWEYGEDLRRWHNLDAQLADEGERANESGGVVDPGIVNVRGLS